LGLKRFYTGIPCNHGHDSERYVSNGKCASCSKSYSRNYRKKHPLCIQEYNSKYYTENKAYFQNHAKEYRKKHLKKLKKQCSDYYYSHQKEASEYAKKWQTTNPERHKENGRRWRRNHPEIHAFHARRYKARKKDAQGSHTLEDWLWLCEKFDYRCLCCGKQVKLTEDHIQSLFCGGSDYIENIQPLCGPCNSRKHTKEIHYIPADTFLKFPSMRKAS